MTPVIESDISPTSLLTPAATERYAHRAWTVNDIASRRYRVFYDVTAAAREQIWEAVQGLRRRKIHLGIIEPEDFRVPAFGRDVPELRRRLDDECGFVVLRGLEVDRYTRDENAMVYWGLANYIGRVIRQNLRGERLDTVQDRGDKVTDPYRLIETTRYFLPHTDNAMLEPRWPDYLGLLCLHSAQSGGENLVISAYTLLREISRSHPDFIERLSQPWHIDPPIEQRIPGGAATWSKPIFEVIRDELRIHYLRYYIDPGMRKAGCPMTAQETQMLDFLDTLLERPEFAFSHKLEPGEILLNNNNWTLHGRKAFVDHEHPEHKRLLMRIWLWRRHVWPGTDPIDLDTADGVEGR
ncbi:MAG TPA: TauD/TfdA family dioxygenase [Terrimicrobiaceae bacterium]|nr:TauD/TfdA family dioxygenase [Terrimicrobiaceae bacterium]